MKFNIKSNIKLLFTFLLAMTVFSCEDFFTTNWFQGAADYSNISLDEALSSGNIAIMKEVFNRIKTEAANATGEDAAGLYLEAADLALGISGMSDPSVLLSAATSLGGGGGTSSLFSILTETNVDLVTLAGVDDLLEDAFAADPASVPPDVWLFAAAGQAAEIAQAAEMAGQTVENYLPANPLTDPDIQQTVQYLIDSIPDFGDGETSPIEDMLADNQADLEIYPGITYP